ncbi:nucleotidyltransferase family protein [Sphingomonas gilva]|uniref:Nucleotidyltransferase family protein n=1 Tax=Sphingomonas gilva TaxID=2305907 RepID=A0A396RR74_9SPHN|nr:nucleotidyltransferase family protein [Sphingomonas gilva]RHW19134.1 nucleotidyltransferase family protein [Sphingomonas gilva]
MIRAEDTALVLLAAGRSRRFGAADKLAQPFLHQPLGLHVVTALEAIPFRGRYAVVDGTRVDFAARGLTMVRNDDPDLGLSRSVMLGVTAAKGCGCAAVLIALADMPRVTAAHVWRLLDYAEGPDAIVASSNGDHPTPPVLFGAAHFDMLLTLEGQAGARDLVRAGHHMVTSPDELVDIDTPEQLAALRKKYGVG